MPNKFGQEIGSYLFYGDIFAHHQVTTNINHVKRERERERASSTHNISYVCLIYF